MMKIIFWIVVGGLSFIACTLGIATEWSVLCHNYSETAINKLKNCFDFI